MRRNLLAAGAAAFVLACPGALAATTASNDQFTVTTDWMGLFGDVSIADGVVSATSSFSSASGYVIPMHVGSDYALSFQAAPGYTITGYELDLQVTGGAATYSGPSYGSAPAAYATFGATFGQGFATAGFDGPDETHVFTATLPAGDVSGGMSFYAFPSSFCTVPLVVCQDIPEDTAVLWAFVNLDYFRVTPIIEPIAAEVGEPSTLALLALGAVGAAARRRPVSGPSIA